MKQLWFVNHDVKKQTQMPLMHVILINKKICIMSFDKLLKNKPFMQGCVISIHNLDA